MGFVDFEPIVAELIAEDTAAAGSGAVSPGQLRLFELREGLPTLLKLSLTFAAIGLCALVVAFIDFMDAIIQRTVGRLPGVGHLTGSALQWARSIFTNKIGSLYSGVDHQIGHSFYQLARLGRLLGAVVLATAAAVTAITLELRKVFARENLAPVVGKLGKQAKAAAAHITIIRKQVVNVTKVVTRGATVIPVRRVHALETEVKQLQAQQAKLRKQVAATAHPSTLTGAAEVTALGLAALGANWVRCEGSKSLGKGACNAGPKRIEKWLAGLALLTLTASLEELAVVGRAIIADGESVIKQFA